MIDVYSKADYPSCELSNFAEHPFELDGRHIAFMESFLQSLKYMMAEKKHWWIKEMKYLDIQLEKADGSDNFNGISFREKVREA